MASAYSSHGTLLKIGDGGGTEAFTTIAEVRDITGPSIARRTEEVTNHGSSGWAEHAPTIMEGGEVSFELNYYSATTQDTLETDMGNGTIRNFQIVFPVASGTTDTRSFAAIITGFELQAPVEGVLRASCTLLVTGSVTKAVA